MKNKKLQVLAAITSLVINVFILGTLVYFAVDVFALYSENQFTGRMRSFDVEYWNAVGGVALLLVPARIFSIINKSMLEFAQDDDLDKSLKKVLKRDAAILQRLAEEDGGQLPPPKNPPFFN